MNNRSVDNRSNSDRNRLYSSRNRSIGMNHSKQHNISFDLQNKNNITSIDKNDDTHFDSDIDFTLETDRNQINCDDLSMVSNSNNQKTNITFSINRMKRFLLKPSQVRTDVNGLS